MKILLLGEYSRLHNSLKEGLIALGHEVTIVGCGDKFKKFPVDYSIYAAVCNDNKIANFLFKSIRKVLGLDFEKIEKAILLPKFWQRNENTPVTHIRPETTVAHFDFFSLIGSQVFWQQK